MGNFLQKSVALIRNFFHRPVRAVADRAPAPVPASLPATDAALKPLAWGAKVSFAFRQRVDQIGAALGFNSNYLMAVMAFESGRSFSASVRNKAGSGAVGLIQFMEATARALGTTVEELADMTALQQLDYVEKYFKQWTPRGIRSLEDVYMAVLYPAAIGKPDSFVLFKDDAAQHLMYYQNRGLDHDANHEVTKKEACVGVNEMLTEGCELVNMA